MLYDERCRNIIGKRACVVAHGQLANRGKFGVCVRVIDCAVEQPPHRFSLRGLIIHVVLIELVI